MALGAVRSGTAGSNLLVPDEGNLDVIEPHEAAEEGADLGATASGARAAMFFGWTQL